MGTEAKGNASLIFDSKGTYRGFCSSDDKREIAIYKLL